MKNKFLKMTFMALCLSTSSVVHGMNEEGDEETIHAPVLFSGFSGEYEVGGFPESNGSIIIYQNSENSENILALHLKLNNTSELRSKNPNLLQPLLKLGENNLPDNLVALFHNDKASTPEVTRYCGERTLDGCKMEFELKISGTPNLLRAPGEKGIELWVRSNIPPVVRTVVVADTELDYGVDFLNVMSTIHLILKKADDQIQAQGPWSSSN